MDRQWEVVRQRVAMFMHTLNFLFLVVSVFLIGISLFSHHDDCDKHFTTTWNGIWAGVFVMCCFWLLGTMKNIPILLWMYLITLGSIIIAMLLFIVAGFILTKPSTGHHVDGLRFKEYHLQDYNSWVIKKLNNSHSWENYYKKCYATTYYCRLLPKRYTTREEYQRAKLDPIEAGCCRPPSECGYPAINVSYYNLSITPISSHKDCKLYENSKAIKCFDCESCKAGVAQDMKTEWRLITSAYTPLPVILIFILYQGCLVRRNVEKFHRKQADIYPDNEIAQREV